MSALNEQITLLCGRCEFKAAGETDGDARYALRRHLEEAHEGAADEEAPDDLAPARHIGSPVPKTGKSITELAREERAVLLEKTITVRCMDCPDWEAVGPARAARLEWAAHRLDEHDDETAMRSVERMDREITKRDLQKITIGANDVEANLANVRRQGGGRGVRPQDRTCEEVPGCTKPTISDRGRYARVCAEHKDLVTERYRARNGAAATPVPPPEPEAVLDRVESGPGPQIEEPAAQNGGPTLIERAQRVADLIERRRTMLAELDALEQELRSALGECESALAALRIEEAA